MKHINKLIVSLLFMGYAICIMIILLTGANIYKEIHNRGTEAYNNRINSQYILNHIRQSEDISIEEFGDSQALVLHNSDEEYITKIYFYNGYIMELFISCGSDLEPGAGTRIAKTECWDIELKDALLKISGIEENEVIICVNRGGI